MKISDIDKCVCLCLDKRQEHWQKNINERNFGLKIEPFICGKGNYDLRHDYIDQPILRIHNSLNCWKIIFKSLKEQNIKLALLLEDDFIFTNDFLEGLNFVEKDSFDVCLLGSFCQYVNEDKNNFGILDIRPEISFAGFHGILIKENVFDEIINFTNIVPVDTILGNPENKISCKYNIKILTPSIIIQQPIYSEVSESYPSPSSGLQHVWNMAKKYGRI